MIRQAAQTSACQEKYAVLRESASFYNAAASFLNFKYLKKKKVYINVGRYVIMTKKS